MAELIETILITPLCLHVYFIAFLEVTGDKARASSDWNLQDIGLTPSGCNRVGLCGKPWNGVLITVSICFLKTTITQAPALETAVALTTTKVSLARSFHRKEHTGIRRVQSGNSLFYSCLYNLPQNLIWNLCLWFACIEPNLCRVCLRSRADAGLSQTKHIYIYKCAALYVQWQRGGTSKTLTFWTTCITVALLNMGPTFCHCVRFGDT